MNYATQYPSGNYQRTRTKSTTTTAPTIRRVLTMDAKSQRHKRSTERQTEICTHSNVTNGFLKCGFLPKLKTTQSIQDCKKTAKTQRDFYKSLSQLAEHYGIEPLQTENYGYPYNMVLAMWDAENKLKQNNINWDNLRLVQDSKKTFFTSEERYSTGTTLYYIPVVPLFQMLHDPKRKKTAHLLVSVCSYLYHIAHIPYYSQENSYLYWMYEMMNDWVEQDDYTEETDNCIAEIVKAKWIGERIEQKLFNRINLQLFEQRLNNLKTRDTFDLECQKVACDAFALYSQYPYESIFRNAPRPEEDPYTDENDSETVGMEKYISFIADTTGWLYESLADSINNEFNEYGAMEEPTICKYFDGSNITQTNLDFENRLFSLLDELCTLLYDYKTTRK
ncbi:hypothetical protein [Flavobacterium sp. 11]|uniref:hypothetical protein n=1 Tax=Flavobacterium sp. 11 TaxID=357523 RepID=UPI000C1A09C7|nr:hypothetical protein [Flavobacterium sp. 11]PIF62647.1 hypothetical protein CLV00_2299 [Flavobacterium sp. 11]